MKKSYEEPVLEINIIEDAVMFSGDNTTSFMQPDED